MAAKFKVGDHAFSWEAVPHGRVQFEGTVVQVFPKGTLSKTQEWNLVVIEEVTQLSTRFHIYEEAHVHHEKGMTYANDPYNEKVFAAYRAENERNTIPRSHPKL